jgi:hypothetical protein
MTYSREPAPPALPKEAQRVHRRESPADFPHGGVPALRERPSGPAQPSPEVLQLLEVVRSLSERLETAEHELAKIGPKRKFDARRAALTEARRRVTGLPSSRPGRLPMTAAEAVQAEIAYAEFLMGDPGADPR